MSARFGFFLDVVQSFPDRQNFFRVFVGDFDPELFFEGHYQLDRIERVGAKVFHEAGFERDLILLDSELLTDNFFHPFFYSAH